MGTLSGYLGCPSETSGDTYGMCVDLFHGALPLISVLFSGELG